jgi:GT2 family glycosyltransferase
MFYVVIPVHNRSAVTCRCLESIYRVLPDDVRVIVVDDGSTDGTASAIRDRFPWVTVLSGSGSLWWSGSVNLGIRYALSRDASAVITLNDDTQVSDRFFAGMFEQHQAHPHALLGALEIDADTGRISHAGERMRWWTGTLELLSRGLSEPPPRPTLARVTHLNGRGLLIPAEVFHKIGFFDALRLPQRAGDFDFTHRAARAGFALYCNYQAPLLIYPQLHSGRPMRQVRSLHNYMSHLFSLRGDGHLKTFTIYSLKNCPPICLPTFLAAGYARRLLGYWIRPVHQQTRQ